MLHVAGFMNTLSSVTSEIRDFWGIKRMHAYTVFHFCYMDLKAALQERSEVVLRKELYKLNNTKLELKLLTIKRLLMESDSSATLRRACLTPQHL